MKTVYSLLFLFFLWPFAAFAQDVSLDTLCRLLPEYRTPEGVEYSSGVDVHGKAVMPADLNEPPKPILDVMEIPIQVDLAERFNRTFPEGVFMEPAVAMMRIYKDGRVEYNGQDVSAQTHALCGGQVLPPAGNGQNAPNAVNSGGTPDGKRP